MALKKDGTVWAWGGALRGALGIGYVATETYGNRPFVAKFPEEPVKNLSKVKAVYATGATSYAVKEDGSVWTWGLDILNPEKIHWESVPFKWPPKPKKKK